MQEAIQDKVVFLKIEYIPLLQTLPPGTERKWGKMDLQQTVEHMADSFGIASGRIAQELITPEEHLPKMQDFLKTEKLFKENTVNKLMSEEPQPIRHADINDSIDELQNEINQFFLLFEERPTHTILNAQFGILNFELWVRLLYKHAWHHLRQFGVEFTTAA